MAGSRWLDHYGKGVLPQKKVCEVCNFTIKAVIYIKAPRPLRKTPQEDPSGRSLGTTQYNTIPLPEQKHTTIIPNVHK